MKFDKGTSPTAEKFIMAARAVLYSAKSIPALKQIVAGAKSLELGAAPFLAMTLMHLQAKLGPLSDPRDKVSVLKHMSEDVAEIAHKLHDPAAKDVSKTALKIFVATARMMMGQHPGTGQPTQPQGGAPPQQPPLAQMQPQGGMQ